ncbi:sensor histidine kinase [Dyadobacter fermentans]|uniref:sensor histidine kinase n=1 Tax=Dyadobacter fermentans TaxID=94254 RepID=UPI001CBDB0A0|nr:two-component regulator propeller domain-containing protein [Dyadobacter fermentans]MBZ1361929.1 hypothetical protein [Dyadobacter fermentans]
MLQILALQVASQPAAKETKYSVRHYTSDNGLPQNTVRAITQDQEGFIWLATDMGLVRFDGQSFVTFGKDNLGLESSSFLSFITDIEGRHERLYAVGEKLTHIRIADGKAIYDKSPLDHRIHKMFKPSTRPYDLMYMLGLPDRWNKDFVPTYNLFLLPKPNGDFYIWSKGGKIDFYARWKKQKTYQTQLSSPIGLFKIGTNLYYDNEAGSIRLIATSGLARAGADVILEPARGNPEKPDLSKPYKLYADDLSGKAFIYQDLKLYALSERAPGHLVTSILLTNVDFGRNGLTSVFYDSRHQRLYLGTITNGLFIYDLKVFEALGIETDDPGLNVYYAQAILSDSSVITPHFYVVGKSNNGQNFSRVIPHPLGKAINGYTIVKSRSGDIWIAGYGWSYKQLYRYDSTGKQLKQVWNLGSDISFLYEDQTGRIWLGMEKDGVKYIEPGESGMPVRTLTNKIKHVSYMLKDGNDVLWVGTHPGLYKVNLARNTVSAIQRTNGYYIKSLLLPRPGELWFTTDDDGFFLIQNGRPVRFPLDRDHFLSNAHCIVHDRKDFFWIPTNQGLFRILRSDLLDFASHGDSTRLYYHRYSKHSGFRINEFNGGCQPCAIRLRNDYVSLPSMGGLVFFKPEQIPVDTPHSKIFIDRVEANSGNVPVNGSKIQLAGVSDLRVFFSSPYLAERQNQQLYYTVSEEDRPSSTETWFPIEQEQHFISLNNLTSGTYTLKIRKNTGFGPNSVQLATLTIVVPYPWYDTWPFKLVIVTLVLVAIYFYFKSRLKKADQLNRALESRVSEKTRNLQDTLSVLKESEQELLRQTRLQMHLIASISHDIRSPLRSIEFASGKVRGLLQEGELELVGAIGSSVNESSGRVLLLLENILSYVKSQMSGASAAHDTFAVKGLVDEIAVIFDTSFKVQENKFVNNIPGTLLLKSNRQLLKIILHNLIDNANKYTSGGSVIVTASRENEVVRLLVTDTGPGLPEAVLNWFNGDDDTIYPQSPDNAPDMHGIGLVIVKELAGMLHVRIKAISISGAVFSIEFWNT